MSDVILKLLWNLIRPYVEFGYTWILLIPFVATVAWFRIVQKYKELKFRETCKNSLFWGPSLAIFLLCYCGYIGWVFFYPLPENKFVIAIADFKPVTDDAKKESENLRDRVATELGKIQSESNVKIQVKLLREIIDPSTDQGIKDGQRLGQQYKAHIVVCGKVRLDEEYYYQPLIINLIKFAESSEINQEFGNLAIRRTVSEQDRIDFKKQKVEQVTDLIIFILGFANYESGRYQEAADIFKSIPRQTGQSLYYIGNCFLQLDELEASVSFFDRSINLEPSNVSAWINKGVALDRLGSTDDAMKAYDKAIELSPDDAGAWYNKGLISLETEKFGDALKAFEKVTDLDPEWVEAWVNKGFTLDSMGRPKSAIQAYDKAIELEPDNAYAWYNKGCAHMKSGSLVGPTEALKAFNKAIELRPDFAEAWSGKGLALLFLLRKKPKDEALKAIEKAIELEPDLSEAWYNKGLVLSSMGNIKEAKEAYDKAKELNSALKK